MAKSQFPPPFIDNAKVLLWAWAGQNPFGLVCNENGTDCIEIYGLAICQYADNQEFYRFSCNKNWETIQDGLYESIEEAVRCLPKQYQNIAVEWQKIE